MTQDEIIKAFNNRWRIKSTGFMELDTSLFHRLKELCREFFEAGVMLGQGFVTGELILADNTPTGIEVTVMHDPILDTDDNGFSEWWDMYDKKIDRGKCEKKWAKLTDAEKRACIAAAPAYVASTPDLQFRRNPMTYLNNKSWENQIIPRNNGTDNKSTIEQQRKSKLTDILVG